MQLKLEIVTPTGKALDVTTASVVAPGALGEFAVLPDHRPGVVLLSGGAVRYVGTEAGATPGVVFIRGGVAEIAADRMLILADEAVKPEDVNAAQAAALRDQAEAGLSTTAYLADETLRGLETTRRFADAMLAGAAGR